MSSGNGEEDDEDDIAELFSFGSGDADAAAAGGGSSPTSPSLASTSASSTASGGGGGGEDSVAGSLLKSLSAGGGSPGMTPDGDGGNRERSDSFVEFLEAQGVGGGTTASSTPLSPTSKQQQQKAGLALDDETQELLEWLDHNDNDEEKNKESSPSPPRKQESPRNNKASSTSAGGAATITSQPPAAPSEPTVVKLPPLFTNLAQALESSESTVEQIRKLGVTEISSCESLTPQQRAELYSRLLTNGKQRWSDICDGSLAESFLEFCESSSDQEGYFFQQHRDLAAQIAACHHGGGDNAAGAEEEEEDRDVQACQDDINKLLSYHYSQQQKNNQNSSSSIGSGYNNDPSVAADQTTGTESQYTTIAEEQKDNANKEQQEPPTTTTKDDTKEDSASADGISPVVDIDPLLPPAAASLLAALTHPSLNRENPSKLLAATSVLWQRLLGTRMPLLPLPQDDRWEAICTLHLDFYLLATYHLPLIANHLDRYLTGWYWPKRLSCGTSTTGAQQQQPEEDTRSSITEKSRHIQQQGKIAPSWLVTSAAGECSHLSTILYLWDKLFLDTNNSMSFFLLLALLEQQADRLLLLTGDALQTAIEQALTNPDLNQDSSNDTNSSDALHSFVNDWWSRAQSLRTQTPTSVLGTLRTAEDKALQRVLQQRQERAQAALKARLEAEREAHRQAQEAKAQAARDRLTRARLVVYYRKHAPDKEDNIDRIMETYVGRYDVLDNKLRMKYGEGFNPALKPKPPPVSKNTNKLLSTMNQGLGAGGRRRSESEDDQDETPEYSDSSSSEQVSVLVAAAEVLPVLCWTREAAAARGQQRRRRLTDQPQLKFFLVDCRSSEAAFDQGRFPTAIHLSPEHLLDPDHINKMEEMFESLRGAAHIVVMGEGYAALPNLYPDYKINPKLEQLMQQDEAQTNMCALFFVKKGFPFVSVLNGGFCAAHSWLVRDGPRHHLTASQVIVDYDPDASLFGQLETLHNTSSVTEKAQLKMQFLMDKSMAAMSKKAVQIERFADHLDGREERQNSMKVKDSNNSSIKMKDLGLKKTFAGIRNSFSMDTVDLNEPSAEKGKSSVNKAQAETKPDTAAASSEAAAPNAPTDSDEKESTEQGPAKSSTSPAAQPVPAAQRPQQQQQQQQHNRFTAASGMLKNWGSAINQVKKEYAAAGVSSHSSSSASSASNNARDGKPQEQQQQQQQQPASNMMKRNPFARFGGGGGGAKPGVSNPGGGGAAAGFGGFNQFRRTALSRVRSGDGASLSSSTSKPHATSATSGGSAAEEEASISLASQSTTGDSSSNGEAAAATMVALPPPTTTSNSPRTGTNRKNPAEVERV